MKGEQISLFDECDSVFKQDFNNGVKKCSKCKKVLHVGDFAKLLGKYRENRRSACKECFNKSMVVREKLRFNASPKPTKCECCGQEVGVNHNSQICFDHCDETETFRGWICQACNAGIGKLGDTLKGVLTAALYLSKNNVDEIFKSLKEINNE